MKVTIIALILVLSRTYLTFAQGFINLDFEGANLSDYSAGLVPASSAIPGWTAYFPNGAIMTNINYNITYSGPNGIQVEIINANTIQGNYYMYLTYDSIGQIGTIPSDTQSLIFWGNYDGAVAGDPLAKDIVSFNGQALSVIELEQTANYNIYGIDVSKLAGQTGQLSFSALAGIGLAPPFTVDNIQFLNTPIPEPSPSWLLLLGSAGLLYFQQLRKTHEKRSNNFCHLVLP